MKKRFVLGVGIGMTVGFVLGAAKASEKLLSVEDIRKAFKKHIVAKTKHVLYGYDADKTFTCNYDNSYAYVTYTFDSLSSAQDAYTAIGNILGEYAFVSEADVCDICGIALGCASYKDSSKRGWKSNDGWRMSYDINRKGWTIYLPKSKETVEEE